MNDTIEIDDSGLLIRPSLHDKNLLGIRNLGNKMSVLTFAVTGGELNLIMSGVKYFKASNFCEGNIVSSIVIENIANVSLKRFSQLFDGSSSPAVNKAYENCSGAKLSFIELESSYGCEIYAVIEGVRAERRGSENTEGMKNGGDEKRVST